MMTNKNTLIFILTILTLFLSSCSSISNLDETIVPTASSTKSISSTLLLTQVSTASLTPTKLPSPTATQMILAERIPILEYHNPSFVLSDEVMMTPEWFEDQMKYLHDHGYMTLDAEQLVDFLNGGSYPQKSVVISFDIGVDRRSEYAEIVIPTLRKYGLNAVVFLLANTNLVGDDCNKGELFCWSELKSWSDEGLISVESHGIWHMDYAELDAETQKLDASLSKQVIETNIGKPVLGFAYPYDSINSQTITILKSIGYQFAVGGFTRNDRSAYRWDKDPYYLPRVYPYSNPNMYPGLSSNSGMTFDELMTSQTSLIGLEPPSSGDGTPTPTNSIESTNKGPIGTASEYITACNQIDKITNQVDRIYQLNHLSFEIDLSLDTQASLPAPVKLVPSCNYRSENTPRAIILHSTRGPLTGAITTFQKKGNTSAHYIIDRDGTVIQVLPESLGAYHVSCYGSRANCVASCPICDDANGNFVEPATQSIGIELVNGGTVNDPDTFDGPVYEDYGMAFGYRYWDDYPEAQIQSLILLVNDIRNRWNIPLDMVMGHYRINTNTDPGPALNLFWDRYGDPFRSAIFPPGD
ncbi:MAG TPA: polysaccharide deacetylase family protein [Anaerolineales bacterium]|nr:polysaccharide deacetylase family protein [Anaerolineales bacterium]